jgi:hypothetical protein
VTTRGFHSNEHENAIKLIFTMKTYIAHRIQGEPVVDVVQSNIRRYRLSPRRSQRIVNHSPTGFEWNYYGSGPAQLALAILLDCTNDRETAQRGYQRFKDQIIGPAPEEGFTITEGQIREWLKKLSLFSATTPPAP